MKELFAAVEQGDYDKLQQLLEQKSDDNSLNINAKDKNGNTLLHFAAIKGQIKILEMLLQAGADLDLQDAQGRTPLAVAKEQQQEAAVQYLATYAKREIIESVDATAHPRLSSARWSSIQFARPLEEQDTESSPLLAQNLPSDVAQLLAQCQLNERELEKAMVKLGELKRLLKKSPYGHVLYSLAIQRFLQKVAMWPLLTKRAIQQPENKKESKEKKESEELKQQPSKDSVFTRHLWPKNKSVLVGDPKVLTKVYGINGFFDGAGFVINRGWTGLILVLLGLDIYNYYAYPFDRDITNTKLSNVFLGTASNEKSLSTLLLDPRIWPGILALPLLWGLGKALFSAQQKAWDTQAIDKITAQFNHYHPSLGKDLMQWLPALISFRLLPEPLIKRLLDQIERALLWDGHLPSKERLKLFQAVRQLARTASRLTRLQALATLAALADGVSPYDFPKLVEAGIDKEMLQTLLYLKTEAFSDLRNFAERKIYSEENEPITVSRFHAAYAHYQLWRLGQPQSYALQPLFWGVTLVQFYLQGYLLWRVVQSVINLVTFYVNKQECLNDGKLWLYMNQVADYVCSVCGDWPVFYGDIKTDKSCWEGYLQQQRTAREVTNAIERLNFEEIYTADFSNQNFTGEDLNLILPLLKKKAPGLQELFLNNTNGMLINEPPLSGARAIAEFITNSSLQTLALDWLGITADDTAIIAQVLPDSLVQVLSLSTNLIDDAGAAALGEGLPGSKIQELDLNANNISDAGVATLAQYLRGSSIQELDLGGNNISDAGVMALAQYLPGSSIQSLDLEENNIGDAGMTALAQHLRGSSIQSLDLTYNNIGDGGMMVLAQYLPGSSIQTLYLGGGKSNFGDLGATALAQHLSGSSIQALILWSNNIGDAGVTALAQRFPGSSIQAFGLGGSNISDVGMTTLAQHLPGSSIQALGLGGINISDVGMVALAQHLPGSSIRILYLGGNHISDVGVTALAQYLSDSAVQLLNLEENNIGDGGMTALAQYLPSSSIQSLDLDSNHIGDAGVTALAQHLPGSSIQELNLEENNISDTGVTALAQHLLGSSIQTLYLDSNHIGDVGVIALAQCLPSSSIQTLDLNNNNIGDPGAIAIANVLTTVSISYKLPLEKVNSDAKKVLAKANPNTNLTILDLIGNQISNAGAQALCRVLPQTAIKPDNFYLYGNPVDPDLYSCHISSASTHAPHQLFSVAGKAYKTTIHYMLNSYQQVKNYFVDNGYGKNKFEEHIPFISFNTALMNTRHGVTDFDYPAISMAINNSSIPDSLSSSNPNNYLPVSQINSSFVTDETYDANIESSISLGEKFIVGQFLVGLVKKYSPFTLPWNKEHSLTAQEQATLKNYQKRLQQLEQNFANQHKSRAAAFESVADRFAYINEHLPKIQRAITKAFKHNKITSAELQDITTIFNRVQECSQAIAKENQRLRKLEIKEYRQLRRAAKAGREQPAFKYSYDVVKQTLKHKVVKERETIPVIPAWTPESRAQGCETLASLPTGSLLPCKDDKKVERVSFAFGLLQQFWSRGDKINSQPTAIEQARSDNIPKLPK